MNIHLIVILLGTSNVRRVLQMKLSILFVYLRIIEHISLKITVILLMGIL